MAEFGLHSEPFTEREKRIWDAAYAAAFSHDFFATLEISDFDRAVAATSGERAAYVADYAVHELRRWRLQENRNTGDEFQPFGVGYPTRG